MTGSPTRDIQLADTFNLRDLGGYPTTDGRRVRWRRLFRGAGLQRLAGGDVDLVRELGLVTAIDLRTTKELEARGGYPVEVLPVTFHHLPMIEAIWDLSDLHPDEAPERYLVARYREMLDEGRATIAETVRILSREENLPAVFYCAAGKDRTGVLAGLVLDALGVEAECIVADYHLSKDRVDRIRARAGGGAMVDQPPAFMQAPEAAMELLLAWICDEHGSTAAYLDGIGVPGETIAALQDNLLEPQ